MKVKDKLIVVTGAGAGIGRELAVELLHRGAHIAAIDNNEASLQKLAQACEKYIDKLSLHTVDIVDKDSVKGLPKIILSRHNKIDGIINCAGIIQPFSKVNDIDYDAIERVMNVNFYGTLYMTKTFLPHLLKRPVGHIVNISSMGGFVPVPGQAIYGASKAAVKLLTEALYAELLNTSVNVTLVFPGATDTDIAIHSNAISPKRTKNGAKNEIKTMSPKEVANIIIDGMEKNKPQIFTGKDANMMSRLYRISPGLAIKIIAKRMASLLN